VQHGRGTVQRSTDAGYSILFGFTGRPLDASTGLQNNGARWYADGRWLSEDPIGFFGGTANLYEYVGNAPTMYVDPDGWERTWGEYTSQLSSSLATHFASDYLHYLSNPSTMDTGLRYTFYASTAVATTAAAGAGLIVLAGAATTGTAVAGGVTLAQGGHVTVAGGAVVGAGVVGTSSAVRAGLAGEDMGVAALRGMSIGAVTGAVGSLFHGGVLVGRLANGGLGGAADGALQAWLAGGSFSDIVCNAAEGFQYGVITAGLFEIPGPVLRALRGTWGGKLAPTFFHGGNHGLPYRQR
jgi:RHS repeat-associated protein